MPEFCGGIIIIIIIGVHINAVLLISVEVINK